MVSASRTDYNLRKRKLFASNRDNWAEPNFIVPKALLHSTLQTPHSKLIFHPIAFSVLREMPLTSMWKKMLHQMELVRS